MVVLKRRLLPGRPRRADADHRRDGADGAARAGGDARRRRWCSWRSPSTRCLARRSTAWSSSAAWWWRWCWASSAWRSSTAPAGDATPRTRTTTSPPATSPHTLAPRGPAQLRRVLRQPRARPGPARAPAHGGVGDLRRPAVLGGAVHRHLLDARRVRHRQRPPGRGGRRLPGLEPHRHRARRPRQRRRVPGGGGDVALAGLRHLLRRRHHLRHRPPVIEIALGAGLGFVFLSLEGLSFGEVRRGIASAEEANEEPPPPVPVAEVQRSPLVVSLRVPA